MTTKGESLVRSALSEVGNGTALAMLLAFLAGAAGNGGVNAPLANALFVDGSYTGALEDGSVSAPYKTVQAAVNAVARDNTSVVVMPGTYPENIVMPVAFNNTALVGLSKTNTTISGTAVVTPTITYAPTSPAALKFEISNLHISSAVATAAVVSISGVGGGALTPQLNDVLLDNVDITTSAATRTLLVTSANALRVQSSFMAGALASLINVSAATIDGGDLSALTVTFDAAVGIVPVGLRGTILLKGGTTISGSLTLVGHPSVECDSSTSVGTVADTGLNVLVAAPFDAPRFRFYGKQGSPSTAGAFGLALPTAAVTGSEVDLAGAKLFGTFAVSSLAGTTSSVNLSGTILGAASVGLVATAGVLPVNAQGAVLTAATGVFALTGAGIVNLNVRGMTGGASPPYTAGGGVHTVDRDQIVIPAFVIAGAATAHAFGAAAFAAEPPFPAGVTYGINCGQNLAIAAVADIPFSTAHAAGGFTLTSTGGTTADFVLTRTGELPLRTVL